VGSATSVIFVGGEYPSGIGNPIKPWKLGESQVSIKRLLQKAQIMQAIVFN